MTTIVRNGLPPVSIVLPDRPPLVISSIQIGATGPAGVSSNSAYTYIQSAANTVWTINHNLGFYPQVSTFDAVDQIEGDVDHINNNSLTVTFSAAVSGTAYLS